MVAPAYYGATSSALGASWSDATSSNESLLYSSLCSREEAISTLSLSCISLTFFLVRGDLRLVGTSFELRLF